MASQVVSEIKLHTYNGDVTKEWYIGFYALSPQSGLKTEIQVRLGLNRQKDRRERLLLGKSICSLAEQSLSDGWNPFAEPLKKYLKRKSEECKTSDINRQTFSQAIDFAIQNGHWSQKTKQGYTSTAGFYKLAAGNIGLANTPIHNITKQHIVQLTNQVKKDRTWSNKAVNKNVIYFAAVLKILKDWDIIPHNPAHDIAKLPETESEKYLPYTQAEKKKIFDALHDKHYRFYVLFMIVYHTGIRPKEVLSLRISDINLAGAEIKIIPDIIAGNSKTKKIRRIPINPHLMQLLECLDLVEYPKNFYVFGTTYGFGKNHITGHKRQSRTKHPDYFNPSPNRIPRNNITLLWKELIWEGAEVHKYLYAAKHTGGNDNIMAGVDLDALKDLDGHSSKQMTEKYISKLKEVHKKKIIEKSPDFI